MSSFRRRGNNAPINQEGIGGDAMSGGAPISLESAPPHQDDVGIVGAFPLRAVSGGAHGLTDWNVKQHAGLARAGREEREVDRIL